MRLQAEHSQEQRHIRELLSDELHDLSSTETKIWLELFQRLDLGECPVEQKRAMLRNRTTILQCILDKMESHLGF